jgi:protoheme ferro-lyase
MTTTEARAVFNSVIATESNPDRVAKLELLREYFTNPEFRKALEDHVWELTQNCCGDAACYNMSSGIPCAALAND